jgi:hypothetical protein
MPRRPSVAVAMATCLLMFTGLASAGEPPPSEPIPLAPGPGELLTAPPVLRPCTDGSPSIAPSDAAVRADVILGIPLAVRTQVRLFESRVWAEAGGGIYLILPGVFAGVRLDSPTVGTRTDTFAFRRGVTAWYLPPGTIHGSGWFGGPNRAVTIVAADLDVLWNHRWTGRFHTEAGLKVGLGAGMANGGVVPAPFLGLIVGCHY